MHLHLRVYGPSGWACVMAYPFPSIVQEAIFLQGGGIIARSLRAHLSGVFGANNHNTYIHIVSERVARSQPAQK